MKHVLLLVAGVLCGGLAHYLYFYSTDHGPVVDIQVMNTLVQHADQVIQDDNNSCQLPRFKTVGSVVADLVAENSRNNYNALSAGCIDRVCSLSLNYCKPWQHQECNQVFLRYRQDDQGRAVAESFHCFDLP